MVVRAAGARAPSVVYENDLDRRERALLARRSRAAEARRALRRLWRED